MYILGELDYYAAFLQSLSFTPLICQFNLTAVLMNANNTTKISFFKGIFSELLCSSSKYGILPWHAGNCIRNLG